MPEEIGSDTLSNYPLDGATVTSTDLSDRPHRKRSQVLLTTLAPQRVLASNTLFQRTNLYYLVNYIVVGDIASQDYGVDKLM